jgi:hypothetical protein
MTLKTLFFACIVLTETLFAHPGGHGPTRIATCKIADNCTKEEAIEAATNTLHGAAEAGPLDKSWKDTKAEGAEIRKQGGFSAWVVTFKNPKEKDKAKQTFYVFVTTTGLLAGANYTGE